MVKKIFLSAFLCASLAGLSAARAQEESAVPPAAPFSPPVSAPAAQPSVPGVILPSAAQTPPMPQPAATATAQQPAAPQPQGNAAATETPAQKTLPPLMQPAPRRFFSLAPYAPGQVRNFALSRTPRTSSQALPIHRPTAPSPYKIIHAQKLQPAAAGGTPEASAFAPMGAVDAPVGMPLPAAPRAAVPMASANASSVMPPSFSPRVTSPAAPISNSAAGHILDIFGPRAANPSE